MMNPKSENSTYIKQQMFDQLKAKSKCCEADIVAIIGMPLLRLVCSKCRKILPRKDGNF